MPARSSGLLCAVFMWPPVDSKWSPGVALCVPVEPSVCDHCAIRLNDEAALEDRREFVAACSVLRECWMGCGGRPTVTERRFPALPDLPGLHGESKGLLVDRH